GEPAPQRGVLLRDLAQEDVTDRAGRLDELGQDAGLPGVQQRAVVVDWGPRELREPLPQVGGEPQARGPREREGAGAQDRLHRAQSSIIFAAMGRPEGPCMEFNRESAAAWYQRNRERSDALFDRIRPEAYESRPIPLRNPICFYEGHLPAFSVNTLLKRG